MHFKSGKNLQEAEDLCKEAVMKRKIELAEDSVQKTKEASALEKTLKEIEDAVENQKKRLKLF